MNPETATPLPRKDSFFGLHFDLHPQKTDVALGADLTEENIGRLLDRAKPDFVQYDCKGHAGYAGYPTKVGWPSPGIVKDSLAVWRKATKERGIGLYIHYSGVWDSAAVEHHPEWACINADGKPDPNATSLFGPYADELMIPQLKEVAAAYDLDGVWADGECWAARWDYSPAALAAWKEASGEEEAPKSRIEPHWKEWKRFQRERFERYLMHWVDALHAFNPRLQVTSNWMYTLHAPKPVRANIDYVSGDYSPMLSVDRARTEARYLANVGMPWDLMAWGFNTPPGLGQTLKTPIHLQQEASVVLMQGGGFQIYYQPTRSGYVSETIVQTAGEVADFCRARQAFSHKSVSVPQVALLHSAESHWDRSDAVHTPSGMEELEGALHILLENHYSVDIMTEDQLTPRLGEFPLVVIPQAHRLPEAFREALKAYAEDGGGLLILGWKPARLFEAELGIRLEGEPTATEAELDASAGVVNLNGAWQKVSLNGAEAFAYRYPTRDVRQGGEIAATTVTYGKGKIGAIFGPVATAFFNSHHPYLRRFVGDMTRMLFPDPDVSVDGPPTIDVALRRTKDGKLCLHLLNTSNVPHSDRYSHTDFIPTVGPIRVRLKMPEKPESVVWEPEKRAVEWSWEDGILTAAIPRLHVHGVLVTEG
jgi:hypothetical protein